MFRAGDKGSQANRLSRLCRDGHGAAVVEFAFVLPLMLVLVFGIIEFGFLLFVNSNMLNAARDATRVLSIQNGTSAQALTRARNGLYINLQGYTYIICAPGQAPPVGATCDTAQFPGFVAATDVGVAISVPMAQAALVDLTGIFANRSLQAKVIMFKEN
jgi:Flp pilus assembly protein TadG